MFFIGVRWIIELFMLYYEPVYCLNVRTTCIIFCHQYYCIIIISISVIISSICRVGGGIVDHMVGLLIGLGGLSLVSTNKFSSNLTLHFV